LKGTPQTAMAERQGLSRPMVSAEERKSMTSVRTQTESGVGFLIFNRPERRNAFDLQMVEEMLAGFEQLEADPEVRVILITGSGKGFCAGADVRVLHECMTDERHDECAGLVRVGNRFVLAVFDSRKPVLAAVNGAAMGGAANLVLACDVCFAAEGARFGYPFHRLGLVPDWGGTYFLPRAVGSSKALELIWSGESIDATEAHRLGIVDRVVPADRLVDEVRIFAQNLAARDPERTSWIRGRLLRDDRDELVRRLEEEQEEQARLMQGEESRRIIGEIVEHLNRKRA